MTLFLACGASASSSLAITVMLAVMQDIDEAIHRLPQDVVDARMQRLKRAVDCSLKKSYLSKDIQDMQTPYAWYLQVLLSTCFQQSAQSLLMHDLIKTRHGRDSQDQAQHDRHIKQLTHPSASICFMWPCRTCHIRFRRRCRALSIRHVSICLSYCLQQQGTVALTNASMRLQVHMS